MKFVSVLAGYEGSAHDSAVLKKAQSKGFEAPEGYFTLQMEAIQTDPYAPSKGEISSP